MKIRNFYRIILTLLLAVVNLTGANAHSFNTAVRDLDPRNHDYLQEDQNTSALYLEETFARGLGPVISKNEPGSGNNLISGKVSSITELLKDKNLNYGIIRDKKEILKTYIFPYHFFW